MKETKALFDNAAQTRAPHLVTPKGGGDGR